MSITDTQEALDLLKQDRIDEAIALLERQVALLPAHVVAHVMLARAYEVKKAWPKALETWENARFLVPNSPVVRRGKQRVVSKLAAEEPSIPSMTPEDAIDEAAPPAPEPEVAGGTPHPAPEATESEESQAEDKEDKKDANVRRETIRLGSGQVAYVKPDSMEIRLSTPSVEAREQDSREQDSREEGASEQEGAEAGPTEATEHEEAVAAEAPSATADEAEAQATEEHGEASDGDEALDETPAEAESTEETPDEDQPERDAFTEVFSWEGLHPGEDDGTDDQGEDKPIRRGPKTGDLDRLIRDLESARIEPDPDLDDIPPPDLDDDIEDLVSETLARIYTAQGQYREAARIYVKLASQDPDQARQHLEKAAELRERADEGDQ